MLTLDEVRVLTEKDSLQASELLELLATLGSGDEELRAWVSDCLQAIRQVPLAAGEGLREACLSSNATIATWACKLLGKSAELANSSQSTLARVLQSGGPSERQAAAAACKQITGRDAAVEQALRLAANSDDPRLSRLATDALSG